MSPLGKNLALNMSDSKKEKSYFPLSELPLKGPSTALPFVERPNAKGESPFFGYALIFV